MALKCTNWHEVELEFIRAKEEYDRKAVEWLSVLGERVVKYAREHGSYTDRTGNLRNSIGYVVVQYGRIVTEDFSIGSGHGEAKAQARAYALEVARNLPTGLLAASENQALAEFVQDAFMADTLRVYTSPDPVGAELGGALKNVIALCAGITDGLGFGDNSKAMLMTRGLTETARLGVALGAQKETFTGLAGVGDLIVTCTSMHSRNRRCGILIGQGKPVQQALDEIGAVVEGYYAAANARTLAQKAGVEMPIAQAAYEVLYEGRDPKLVVIDLMGRAKRSELEESWS